MPHQYYNEIVAWAAGETLQYRVVLDDGTKSKWVDFFYFDDNKSPNFNAENVEWQIKRPIKTRKYKVALCRYKDTFYTMTEDYEANDNIECQAGFIKWISDWIEYEW